MFLEPQSKIPGEHNTGSIEVVCGCMFSGKTEELIRRLRRATIAKQQVEIFKPAVDTRYDDEDVVSHNKTAIRSTPVQFASDILLLTGESDVVGIDEAQFFDDQIVDVCRKLANSGKRVIVAGLDMDANGEPFGPMPQLLAIAEFVTKLHAICTISGSLASFSYKLTDSEKTVELGEADIYEARNRKYFYEGQQEKKDKKNQ
ncbi:thymidine kinase [Roseivirga misakiensis]|uniref:Thymidine kinase n=1 Tax=Roseivirga misakiensis TaxID=1563681 RepID=A0A1E5T601_9BACT|nr:thymidine kinase [Roseivirga misakiensis]OEK06811.1 thymidine kinase [Roseivirga misakiensis]